MGREEQEEIAMRFSEVQYAKQGWLGALLLGVAVLIFGGSLYKVVYDNDNAGYIGMLFATIPLTAILLLRKMRLETTIDDTGICYRLSPIHRNMQKIDWTKIKEATIRKYKPVREYGGWGMRIGKAGDAFSISGDMGLELTMLNGRKLLLGTQKPEELNKAVRTFQPSTTNY